MELTREELKTIIKEAIDEKLNEFWIDREEHYKQHQFLSSLMKWSETCSNTIVRTCIKCFVSALLILTVAGFIAWGSVHFKAH